MMSPEEYIAQIHSLSSLNLHCCQTLEKGNKKVAENSGMKNKGTMSPEEYIARMYTFSQLPKRALIS